MLGRDVLRACRVSRQRWFRLGSLGLFDSQRIGVQLSCAVRASGRVCGFFGFKRCWQLWAMDAQISEYLGELPRGWCLISLCASKFAKILEWFRIL